MLITLGGGRPRRRLLEAAARRHRRDGAGLLRRRRRLAAHAGPPALRPRCPRRLTASSSACATFLGPVARVLVALGNAVTPGTGYRDGPFQSESELRDLVDLAGESAVIEDDEREMIHSVFELGDTVAREVMVPAHRHGHHRRREVAALRPCPCSCAPGFSRIPVVGEDVRRRRWACSTSRTSSAGVNADPDAGSLPVTSPDAADALRAREQAGRRPAARDAARPEPLRGRRRRVRRHRRAGHHRGHHRGDRRRDRRRVRP